MQGRGRISAPGFNVTSDFPHSVGLIITRPTQAASRTDVPAEPYDFDSSHRTLAQILARLKSHWSSGWISATAETLLIAPGESAMAALGRTEDTEAAAAAAPSKCEEEEEGWRRRRDGGGGRGETEEEGGEREEDPEIQTDT